MNQRRAATALLWIATVAGAFVTGRSCTPVDDGADIIEPHDVPEPEPERKPARDFGPTRSRPRVALDDGRPLDERGAPQDASAAVEAETPEPDAFPSIDVQVVRFDGTPCESADVYALAAGGRGVDDLDTVPHVETRADGIGRLRVLRAGRYDVGAWVDSFVTVAEDVEIPSNVRLTLRLPEPALIRVHLSDESPHSSLEEPKVNLNLIVDGADGGLYPGRGQLALYGTGLYYEGSGSWRVEVPRGGRFVLRTAAPFRAVPHRFTAPATIEIARVDLRRATLAAMCSEPDRTWPRAVRVLLVVTLKDHDGWETHWDAVLPAGQRLATLFAEGRAVQLGAPEGVLGWSGPGFLPGSLAHDPIAPDGSTVLTLPVHLDPAMDLPSPVVTAVPVCVTPDPGLAEGEELQYYGLDAEGAYVWSRQRGLDAIIDDSQVRRVFATWKDHISNVADVPANVNAVVELKLERGGYLVVVPAQILPEDLGQLRLEHADGETLLRLGEDEPTAFAVVEPGLVLGPLRPGRITFRLRSPAGDFGEVTATVRAGSYETLKLPRVSAR